MNLAKNPVIREALKNRWSELDLKNADVIRDASERSPEMKITYDRLSKWLKGSKLHNLTDIQILWLCVRYHVPISINIGEPVLTDGKLTYVVPKYNELEALKTLKILFHKKDEK